MCRSKESCTLYKAIRQARVYPLGGRNCVTHWHPGPDKKRIGLIALKSNFYIATSLE